MSATLSLQRPGTPAITVAVCATAVAILLGILSVRANLERACSAQDTPYLDLCTLPGPGSAQEAERLRAHIARNPGDANAYRRLALQDPSPQHTQRIETAARLSPQEPNLLLHRAAAALDRHDWEAAVPPLVQLVQTRDVPAAARSIAELIGMGHGRLLVPHVQPGAVWPGRVLVHLQQIPGSLTRALPLIEQALRVQALTPDQIRPFIGQLKAAGAWGDAYGLWLALHGNQVPALFNGDFDQPFEPDGFDWEILQAGPPSRTGAVIERRRSPERGSVLELRFSGRPISVPLARQYLFLGPGRYRLQGAYSTQRFRGEQGLAWRVRCKDKVQGSSASLTDTGKGWQPFALEFVLPSDCGLVASLQLETFAAEQAALGARGLMAFDALTLEKVTP